MNITKKIKSIEGVAKRDNLYRHLFLTTHPIPEDDKIVYINHADTAFAELAIHGTGDYLRAPHTHSRCLTLTKHLTALNEEYRNIGYGLYAAKINIEKTYLALKYNYTGMSLYLGARDREAAKKKTHPEVEQCADVISMYDKIIARCEKDLIGIGIAYTSPEAMVVRLAGFVVWCNVMNDFAALMNRHFYSMYSKHILLVKYATHAEFSGYKDEKAMLEDFPAVIAKLKDQINNLIAKTGFSGITKESLIENSNMRQVYLFMEYLYNNGMADYFQGIPAEFEALFYAAEKERHIDDLSEEETARLQKEYEHDQWVKQVIAETDFNQAKANYHIFTDNYLDMFVNSYMDVETGKPYTEAISPADYKKYYEDSLAKGYIEDSHGLIKNLIDGYEMIYTVMGYCEEDDAPHMDSMYDAYDNQYLYSNYDDADKADLLKKVYALRDEYMHATQNIDVPVDQKVVFHIPIYINPYMKGLTIPAYFEQC